MKVATIIVSWNTVALLRDCLRALPAAAAGVEHEVVVVDNGSTDGSPAMVTREFPSVRLICNADNVGFARANNQAIRATQSEYVLLLNSDTVARPDALAGLARFMDQRPRTGAAGPCLLRPDGSPQPYAFGSDPSLRYLTARAAKRLLFRRYLHDWTTNAVQEVDWVSGACMIVRRAAIEQVGLLDEQMFMYFEDNEWCLRLRRADWQVYYNPQVAIIHLGGKSARRNPAAQRAYGDSLRYFYRKHYGRAAGCALELMLPIYSRLASAAPEPERTKAG
jgi:N-acetylglucosaminyl-diphospho-decaprenol L-rhamnosyltransferase